MTTTTPSVTSLLQHRDWIRQLARKLVHDQSQVDDVVQRAWLAAVERPPRELANPRGWLTRVVQRQAMGVSREARRRERRERAAARPESQPAAVEVAARADLHRKVVDTVLALEEPCRTVLLLHYFDGRKLREIAEELDKPLGTVKTWLHRGLERMRGLLDDAHDGDRRSWCVALAPLAAPTGGAATASAGAASLWAWGFAVCAALVLGWFAWSSLQPDPIAPGSVAAVADAPAAAIGDPANDAAPVGPGPDRMPLAGADDTPPPQPAPPLDPAGRLRATLVDTTGAPLAGTRVVYRSEHWPVLLDGDRVRLGSTTMNLTERDLAALRAQPDHVARMRTLVPEARRALAAWLAGESFLTEAVADAQGRFELAGTEKWWQASLLRSDWMIYGNVETETEMLMVAGPGVELAGRVVDEAGAPIEGVYLSLHATLDRLAEWERETSGDAFRSWNANTDAEGRFDFGMVPVHPQIQLSVQQRGYQGLTADVPRTRPRDLIYTLTEDDAPQVLTGRVLLADGRPAAGAGLVFGQDGAKADDQGRFRVELTYWSKTTVLAAYLKSHQPAYVHGLGAAVLEREEAGHELELRLGSALLEIEGQLVDAAGAPVASAVLGLADGEPFGNVHERTFESWLGGWKPGTLRTDEEGRFAIPGLSDRGYRVYARLEDSFVVVESAPVRAGTRDLVLRLPEDPARDVRGHVVDRHGAPVVGVTVCVCHEIGRGEIGRSWAVRDNRTLTDDLGAFVLERAPRRHVFYRVTGDGIEPVELAADEFRDGLRIEGARLVELRVTGTPEQGLAFHLEDAAGETVQVKALYPSLTSVQLTSPVEGDDDAPTIEVVDTATTLVLERQGAEVRRIPLLWVPGQRLEIRL